MIFGCWNVRGLLQANKQSVVSSFLQVHKLDICGLLETKFSSASFLLFRNKFCPSWNFCHNFDLVNNGKILLLWNPTNVVVDVVKVEEQVIHARITCRITNSSFHLSLCYGLWDYIDMRPLWDSLILTTPLDFPAIVCGDFNCILDSCECVGGRIHLENEYRDFVDMAAYLSLEDAGVPLYLDKF